jgi:hypothetical protein
MFDTVYEIFHSLTPSYNTSLPLLHPYLPSHDLIHPLLLYLKQHSTVQSHTTSANNITSNSITYYIKIKIIRCTLTYNTLNINYHLSIKITSF